MNKRLSLITLLMLIFSFAKAQDTLITTDNTMLIGEIKSMDRGVLVIETSFSNDDFHVEWLKVKKLVSSRGFRIILQNQNRYYGNITYEDSKLVIHDAAYGNISVSPKDLVYIKQVDEGNILDLINLSLDFGYSFTNAKNLQQLNGDFRADYTTNRWGTNVYLSTVKSDQTDVEPVARNTGGLGFKVLVRYGLFADIGADYMSNTEQMMKLRSNYNLSLGKFYFKLTELISIHQ